MSPTKVPTALVAAPTTAATTNAAKKDSKKFTSRIDVHHGIITAISVKVKSAESFGVKIFYAVSRDKSTSFRVVIS